MTNCNILNILIKAGLFIEIIKIDNYKKANLVIY